MAAGYGDGPSMITPEIGNRNISLWWIWRNMGLESALKIAQASGRKSEPVSDKRMAEILEYFDNVEVDNEQ